MWSLKWQPMTYLFCYLSCVNDLFVMEGSVIHKTDCWQTFSISKCVCSCLKCNLIQIRIWALPDVWTVSSHCSSMWTLTLGSPCLTTTLMTHFWLHCNKWESNVVQQLTPGLWNTLWSSFMCQTCPSTEQNKTRQMRRSCSDSCVLKNTVCSILDVKTKSYVNWSGDFLFLYKHTTLWFFRFV